MEKASLKPTEKRKRRDPEKELYWKNTTTEWRQSGLTFSEDRDLRYLEGLCGLGFGLGLGKISS